VPSPSPSDSDGSFGELLRGHRLRRGLTQQECAEAAGLGVRTLRDLENGRARPRRVTAGLLATALGLEPASQAEFLAAARRPTSEGLSRWAVHLPPAPLLLGRERALAELDAILRQAALVTLVGVAGVGKTSLAWNLAHRVAARHPGGVAGVQVSAQITEAEMLAVVASVFDVARASDLPQRLTGGPSLLLVDAAERNFEPVVAALTWLRERTTGLRLLVTGRRPTGIEGELAWSVGPLETPPEGAATLAEIEGYPAVALFRERLRTVGHPEVRQDQAADLGELVRRLDGLPLALELAAARGRILQLGEILDRYRDRVLDLGDAQATLRDAVASSYRLLDPAQRAALRALAQFQNRWSVRMAEPMLAGALPGGDIVALLDQLIGLGLVSVRGTGPVRFRLLDVVRDFALERSTARGELVAERVRHARVIADLAVVTSPELAGPAQVEAVARLDDISGDIAGALVAAADTDPPTGLRLAAALPRWWRFRGQDKDGRGWLERLLAAPENAGAEPGVRAWALLGLAMLAAEHGEGDRTAPGLADALAIFEQLGDVTGQLAAHTQLHALHQIYGRYALAREHGENALALAARNGRARDTVVAQTNLTWHDIRVGDLAAARRRLTMVRRLATDAGEARLAALAVANLAEVSRLGGRYAEAVQLGRQAIGLLEPLGDPRQKRRVLGIIALAQAQAGQVDAARTTMARLSTDGTTALVEAYLCRVAGDLAAAAEWFASAEQELTGQSDVRDVVEALVGLAACTPTESTRSRALARLTALCEESAVELLPRERDWLAGRPPGPDLSA
jgi:predicted ATPase/DNA-binding XRE family transcriptional regulator